MPISFPKRSQHEYAKKRYRARNWRHYHASLCKRAGLMLWFSQAIQA